jgi:hypothetical protein
MLNSAEMTRGDMDEPEKKRVVYVLKEFIGLLAEEAAKRNLAARDIPFRTQRNFVLASNPDGIYWVVDNVAIGGMPDCTYLDRRSGDPIPSLDALMGAAVHELGFQNPMGIVLPVTVVDIANPKQREMALLSIVRDVAGQLAEQAQVNRLQLPIGYEHYARFLKSFLADNSDIDRNVFLMMRFRSGPQYEEIVRALRASLREYGLNVIRADDKDYTGDLWENVCLHMLGSRYGIAVFEEIDHREFNPNIALELGFMMAQNKRCLILKDKRMQRMPTDIVGKLYREFDTYNIDKSISNSVEFWVRDLGLGR